MANLMCSCIVLLSLQSAFAMQVAQGQTLLGAAHADSSMMQLGAAVDKSNASQEAAAAFAERRTTAYIDLTPQTVWINAGYHSAFNQNGTMTLGTESAQLPPWAPKTSALNLPDPSCTWTLEVGFHITSYSGFKYMAIGFGDNSAVNGNLWHSGNFIVFQDWSGQEGTARGGLQSEGSETNWNQMSLGEFFGNPSSKKYARISYRVDKKIDFQILSADRSQVLFSRVYWSPDNVGWPENVLHGDRSLVQFVVGQGVTTWSDLSIEHSGTCPSPPTSSPTPVSTPVPTPAPTPATPTPTLAPTVAPSPAPTPSPTPAAVTTAPFSIGSTDACSVSSDNVISLNNGGCSIDKQITWDFTDQLVIEFKTRGCKEQDCSTPNVKGPVEPHWFFEPFRSSYAGTGREVPDLWWISRPSDYGFGAYGGWSVSGGSGDGRSPNTNEPSDPIQWHTWAMTFTTAGNCVNLVSWLVDGVSNGFGSDVGNPVTRCSAYGTTTWLGWASYGTTTYTYVKDLSINGAGHISAPAQATPPPAGGAGSGASAVGDPHLQNVRGDRFDLMKAGKHVLINIPRGMSADNALLRVQADARRLGGHCADMYFQELNVTGSWADAKQFGGYHYSVSQREAKTPEWVAFGKVELKVVHGRTDSGLLYLNMYVKHLGRAGFAVGGLLGEDEHADVSAPLEGCVQRLSLVAGTHSAGGPVVASVALASFD